MLGQNSNGLGHRRGHCRRLGPGMRKLKYREVSVERAMAVLDQLGTCPLCEQHLALADAVLDHNHKTGQVRGAIHRFCNTFLSRIENGIARNRITPEQLTAILKNYESYVQRETGMLHPTHKTPEERQARAKKRARARRKK